MFDGAQIYGRSASTLAATKAPGDTRHIVPLPPNPTMESDL